VGPIAGKDAVEKREVCDPAWAEEVPAGTSNCTDLHTVWISLSGFALWINGKVF
jgi:hypothetical protein